MLLLLGSLLAALAPTPRWLVAGRTVAGVGGAFIFGGALGVGGAGLALGLAGDRAAVYRLLGFAVLAGLLVACRLRSRSAHPLGPAPSSVAGAD